MTEPGASPTTQFLSHVISAVRARFSLREDRAEDREIDEDLRQGVTMQGTNLWVLMFAIFIASIGLNVNSTAVIIGAMLISPLMGPIMGVGYGAGIHDFPLIRRGLKNLGIAAAIALITSTVYFLLTPLTGSLSERLARTTPSLWDVLIALFGGLAGIIAVTRKEKSNVIPGVAIATALMPPLCTAGYGLANGAWSYFFGALYLFTINSVFIAASAAFVTRAFHLQRRRFDDPRVARRVQYSMAVVMTITLLPSLYIAYRLVGEEIFRTRATQFVQDRLDLKDTHVSNLEIDARAHHVEVSLIGAHVSKDVLDDVYARLRSSGLPADTALQIFQTGNDAVDMTTLSSSLLGNLYRDSQKQLADKEAQIQQLRDELASTRASGERFEQVPVELNALFPQISRVLIADAPEWSAGAGRSATNTLVVSVSVKQPLTEEERGKIEAWLRTRFGTDDVRLIAEPG
jgi:uncharacterized hydrophobic protein (TIGR00271 family)